MPTENQSVGEEEEEEDSPDVSGMSLDTAHSQHHAEARQVCNSRAQSSSYCCCLQLIIYLLFFGLFQSRFSRQRYILHVYSAKCPSDLL